jgi:hypothetical protein
VYNELGSIWNEAYVAYSGYFLDIYVEGLSKTAKNVIRAGFPAEIRTEHLPNTSLLRSCYINLLFLLTIKYGLDVRGSFSDRGSEISLFTSEIGL